MRRLRSGNISVLQHTGLTEGIISSKQNIKMYNALQNACNVCNFHKFVLSEMYSLLKKFFFPTVKVTPLNRLL